MASNCMKAKLANPRNTPVGQQDRPRELSIETSLYSWALQTSVSQILSFKHAGSKPAAPASKPQTLSENAPARHTPIKPVVKRIGGGYSMRPVAYSSAAAPKMSPLGKQAKPVSSVPISASIPIHCLKGSACAQ